MTEQDEDIERRLKEYEEHDAYRHYKPLSDAAYEFVKWAETPEQRVYTGLKVFDEAMRGTAPGETTIIEGFTHGGKGVVVTEILINNEQTPLIVFTPDESRPLVLTKLTTALKSVSARELEDRIQRDDESARTMMLEVAERYAKLAIFDETVTLLDMDRMLDETTRALGEKPKAYIFDYADLLAGFEDVRSAISALKSWGKRHNLPGFILHQASRTSGADGRKMGITSGAYGGEQQSTHIIGVRRKKYQHLAAMSDLENKIANAVNPKYIADYEAKLREIRDYLLPMDEDTITVSLVKNKRPPCTLVDDQDYRINTQTGRMFRQESHKDSEGNEFKVTKANLHAIRSETKGWEEREFYYEN